MQDFVQHFRSKKCPSSIIYNYAFINLQSVSCVHLLQLFHVKLVDPTVIICQQ